MKKTSRRTSASPPRSRSSPPRAAATRRGRAAGHVPAAAAEVILAFARAAAKARRRWYLFGAQAVAVYGVQRASADVDVTVLASPAEVAPLIAALRAEGITLRIDDPGFIAATRVLPVVHAASGWPADVVLGGPGLEELFADAARQMKVGRRAVPVIAPEHLVVTKLIAGRQKDLEDVRGLLRQPGIELDRAALVETLALVEAALESSELVALFERLERDVAHRR